MGKGRWLCVIVILAALADPSVGQNKKVVCGFSITKAPAAGYYPEYIPLEVCTHVAVKSFRFPRFAGRQMFLDDNDKIAFSRVVTSVRKRSNAVPVVASIQGSARDYSEMSGTIVRRKAFVQAAVSVLLELDADAIELDWYRPGGSNAGRGNANDRTTMLTLLQDLRQGVNAASQHIKGRNRELWFRVGLHPNLIAEAYNIFDICDLVDHVTMDPGYFAEVAKVHAPVTVKPIQLPEIFGGTVPRTIFTGNDLTTTTQTWIDDGCAPRKLLLGVELQSVRKVRNTAFPFNRRIEDDDIPFPTVQPTEFIEYRQFCQKLRERGWTLRWDPYGLMPYMTRELQNSRQEIISYEDLNSLRYKMDLVEGKRFGGIYIDYVHSDDIYGTCGQPYPLTAYLFYRVRSIPSEIGFAIEWN